MKKTTKETLRREIREAVRLVREKNPMAPSITNTVTINLVAHAQLAVGGSAAMMYLADEGEAMAVIEGIVKEREEFIRSKGMAAVGPLMGPVMGALKGKLDGKQVNRLLTEAIKKLLG